MSHFLDRLMFFSKPGPGLRPRRRQFRVVDVEHLLLLPQGGKGQRAGDQRRLREPRRQRDAVPDPCGHHTGSLRTSGRCAADRR